MPKIEPVYEPRGRDALDGGEDDHEQDDEGSRLPLLIVIGLLVLVAFGGVVWLAYQHGVERGMQNAPRQTAAQDNQAPTQNYDKIYQKPVPSDEDTANDDTAPAPPAVKSDAAPAPVAKSVAPPAAKPAAPPVAPARKTAKAVTTPPAEATKPPAKLISNAAPAADTTPAPSTPAPSTPATSMPAPSTPAVSTHTPTATGDYVLQIGSYKSQDEAETSWKTFKAKHALAASHSESVKQVDLGAKGTWYRLRIGGFDSKDAADAFCAKLKADGGACILAKS